MVKSCCALWQKTPTVSIASGTALVEGYFTENYPLNAETRLLDIAPERAVTFWPADTNCIVHSTQNSGPCIFCFLLVRHLQCFNIHNVNLFESNPGLCGSLGRVRSLHRYSSTDQNQPREMVSFLFHTNFNTLWLQWKSEKAKLREVNHTTQFKNENKPKAMHSGY